MQRTERDSMAQLFTRYLPIEQALALDQSDPLSGARRLFFVPPFGEGDSIYLTGNSLGLQPRSAQAYLQQELDDWKTLGVEGHFHAKNPWMPYHESLAPSLARLAGGLPSEVVAMGSLTQNLHLALASFYKPSGSRTAILTEEKSFPSDRYALTSHIQWHGLHAATELIEVPPMENGKPHSEETILQTIDTHGDRIALFLFGGVNYFTGQVFCMEKITRAAQAKGIIVGWDLAHAIGNVPLQLHQWNVDFAAWCSYKYLNSSPGGVGGLFVHERHHHDKSLTRLAGWWGQNKARRFLMEPDFDPIPSAEAWQVSNAPILSMAVHRAALAIFDAYDLSLLRQKSLALSQALIGILDNAAVVTGEPIEIFTPREEAHRGSQISVRFPKRDKAFFNALTQKGVVADWREPDCIRMAPVPLYNSFEDLSRLESLILELLSQ